jgi:hypothetical protein
MKYRRLPGKKRSIGHWRTLWMGDDHLLSVSSNGYSEEYTRYYFKDIKALVARRTNRGRIWNGILGILFGMCLLGLFASLGDGTTSWTVTLAILAALLLVSLIINTLQGPTCRCHILMPLGTHELPTLGRIRTLRRTLDRLRPFVVERQGTAVPEDDGIPSAPPADEPVPISFAALPDAVAPMSRETAASPYRGSAHYAAFSLLIVHAFLGVTVLEYHGTPFLFAYGFLTLGLLVCLVTAVVQQYSHPVPRMARRLVWGALLTVACAIPFGYYVGVFLSAMQAMEKANPAMDMQGIVSAITANPLFPFCIVCFSACCAIVGALGLITCLRVKGVADDAGRRNGVAPTRDVAP